MQHIGILIRHERIKKNWSQEGLCKGICGVSYLSKIEHGKAAVSQEILKLLFDRLEVRWYDEASICTKAKELVERIYDAIFSNDRNKLELEEKEMELNWELYSNGPYMLDYILLKAFLTEEKFTVLQDYQIYFDQRQRSLWLLLNKQYDELLLQNPCAYTYFSAGIASYEKGNYPLALERLQRSYYLACESGCIYIMLGSRMFMGNCYSNTMEYECMAAQYLVAERMARAVNDHELLMNIDYNIASTDLELGHVQKSYDYFAALKEPGTMSLHKLAICCEKLGKKEEALAALDRAETAICSYPSRDIADQICRLVRYRLEYPNYLEDSRYAELLLNCFERIRKELPSGYANFHLPWVVEWYKSSRQYKQIYELLLHFPNHKIIK